MAHTGRKHAPILRPDRERPRDAETIRAALLEAARTAFRRRGVSASPTEIAGYAGVGVGTLYRHFENKETLLRLVVEERKAYVMERARLAGQAEDAWEGLRAFLWEAARLEVEDKVMAEILSTPGVRSTYFPEFSQQVHAVLTPLVQRAQEAGQLRPGITPRDAILAVVLASKVVHLVLDPLDKEDPEVSTYWRRLVEIALDGLQAQPRGNSEPVAFSLRRGS